MRWFPSWSLGTPKAKLQLRKKTELKLITDTSNFFSPCPISFTLAVLSFSLTLSTL